MVLNGLTLLEYLLVCQHNCNLLLPPTIVNHPEPELIIYKPEIGKDPKPFELNCAAQTYPADTNLTSVYYYWEKNGEIFNHRIVERVTKSGGSLTFNIPHEEDVGVYKCFAVNELGTASSNEAHVKKWETHPVSFPDQIISVQEGDFALLACRAPVIFANSKIEWLQISPYGSTNTNVLNSRRFMDTDGHLVIPHYSPNLDSLYERGFACVVRARYIGVFFSMWTIIAMGPTMYLTPLNKTTEVNTTAPSTLIYATKDVDAQVGDTVTLFCALSRRASIEFYKLLPSNNGTQDNREYLGMDIHLIEHFVESNAGKYICKPVGENWEHVIEVRLKEKPKFIGVLVSNFITTAGDTNLIDCNASGSPKPTIAWFFNGRPIAEAPPNSRRFIYDSNITIVDMQASDNYGVYGCRATNQFGSVYNEAFFTVSPGPIVLGMTDQTVVGIIGTNITLSLHLYAINDTLSTKFQWFYHDVEITKEDGFEILENGDLHIVRLRRQDAGNFKCRVYNEFGSDSVNYNLKTIKATKVQIVRSLVELEQNQPVDKLECNVEYDSHWDEINAKPTIKWKQVGGSSLDYYNSPVGKTVHVNAPETFLKIDMLLFNRLNSTFQCIVESQLEIVKSEYSIAV